MRAEIVAWVLVLASCGARSDTSTSPPLETAVAGPTSAPTTIKPPTTRGAPSAWNISVPTGNGGSTKLTVFDGNPNVILPSCKCAAGVWQLSGSGETATHFTGTLKATSFNHVPPKRPSTVMKVRKTRQLIGAGRDHRAVLHAIMRTSGSVVLREVTGGEWELVGYAPDGFGDLFANNARWRSDPKRPPKPAERSPIVDPATDAVVLAKLINDYRASIKLPRVPISPALSKVAQAHVRDLNVNKPVRDGCNMHSWSVNRAWAGCCYDSSPAAARCMWAKPKEIARYPGKGYEIAAFASGVTPEQALALWQDSEAHHAVMINKGIWNKPWAALGVAIEGDYGVAWFGEQPDAK